MKLIISIAFYIFFQILIIISTYKLGKMYAYRQTSDVICTLADGLVEHIDEQSPDYDTGYSKALCDIHHCIYLNAGFKEYDKED